MEINAAKCAVCLSESISDADGFYKLQRVTSDSRIWPSGGRITQCRTCGLVQKIVDPVFADEIATVYATYDLYFQGVGKEQKIFVEGVGRPRSELLSDFFFNTIPDFGKHSHPAWLDFGCGKGNLLSEISRKYPKCKLFGADLSERNRDFIKGIPGVEDYIPGGVEAIRGEFDVFSLSHVLEHISQPLRFLKNVRTHIKANGCLLIVVPNVLKNPFDLLVVDHCLHFTSAQLVCVVQAAGFEVICLDEQVIPKELVLVARPDDGVHSIQSKISESSTNSELDNLIGLVNWLSSLVEWGKSRVIHSNAGLFGTALAATWLDHSCGPGFSFFVDEDMDRADTLYLGREVLTPSETPANSEILVPLPSEIAVDICRRLNAQNRSRYIEPPIIGNYQSFGMFTKKELPC